jgi:hypothetical protein
MPGVMNFRALRQQTFAPALPATRQSRASAFRAHPRAKTMLIFSGALGALQSAFHKRDLGIGEMKAATLGSLIPLSIAPAISHCHAARFMK